MQNPQDAPWFRLGTSCGAITMRPTTEEDVKYDGRMPDKLLFDIHRSHNQAIDLDREDVMTLIEGLQAFLLTLPPIED